MRNEKGIEVCPCCKQDDSTSINTKETRYSVDILTEAGWRNVNLYAEFCLNCGTIFAPIPESLAIPPQKTSSKLGKYTRIEAVIFKDKTVGYLLTGDGVCKGLEVDMNSDFYFDNIGISAREIAAEVLSLNDVVKFCKEHNINISDKRLMGGVLRVGGEADMLVYSNLEFEWEEK